MEYQTQEVRKGMIQDGFNIRRDWMTPARIAYEFKQNHPICTYPAEWNHPEKLFSKRPDRIYSIALNLGGEESRSIIFSRDDFSRFKKHLDNKGNLDLDALFPDTTLKTVLIRDKDSLLPTSLRLELP